MKKIIQKVLEFKILQGKTREETVKEVAEKVVETLTKSNLDGVNLSATELATILNIVNPAIKSFLREKKIKTEEKLKDINTALENLENYGQR